MPGLPNSLCPSGFPIKPSVYLSLYSSHCIPPVPFLWSAKLLWRLQIIKNFIHAVPSSLGHSIFLSSKYSVQRPILKVISLYSAFREEEKEAHLYIQRWNYAFYHFNIFHIPCMNKMYKTVSRNQEMHLG